MRATVKMPAVAVFVAAGLVIGLASALVTWDEHHPAEPPVSEYSSKTFPEVLQALAEGAVVSLGNRVGMDRSVGKIQSRRLEPWETERVGKYLDETEANLRRSLAMREGRDSGDLAVQEQEVSAMYAIALLRAERDVLRKGRAFALLPDSTLPTAPAGYEVVRVYAHRERSRPRMVRTVLPVKVSEYPELIAASDRRLALSTSQAIQIVGDWNSLPLEVRQSRYLAHRAAATRAATLTKEMASIGDQLALEQDPEVRARLLAIYEELNVKRQAQHKDMLPGGFDVDRHTLVMTRR